jgi:hypothetical protein
MTKSPLNPWENEIYLSFEDKDEAKKFPGVRYLGLGGLWGRPIDAEPYTVPDVVYDPTLPSLSRAMLGQAETVKRALADGVAYWSRAETGLGKTHIALQLAHARGARSVLVVSPAQVKYHWQEQALKAGYGVRVFPLQAMVEGCSEELDRPRMDITNYEQVTKLPADMSYDLIVCDEQHRIKNSANGKLKDAPAMVRAMFALRDKHPTAFRLGLTATPLANRPIDGWCQLEWLWPGRFGKFWSYAFRYHEILKEKIVTREQKTIEINKIGPPRADTAAELSNRLAWVSMPMLKRDILPPSPPPIVVRAVKPAEYIRSLSAEPGTTLVFCYNRANVEELAEEFPEAICFHGGQTPLRRHKSIEQANEEHRMVIATMDSAGLGIDNLAKRSTAIYTQISWTWVTLRQAMGRNERLSSDFPPQNHFLVNNPHEEKKIKLFCRKLREIEMVMPTGTGLADSLSKPYGEAEFEAELATFNFAGLDWLEDS